MGYSILLVKRLELIVFFFVLVLVSPVADLGANKFFEYKGTLSLTCNVSATPATNDYKMKWLKNGDDVTSIDKLKSRITMNQDKKVGTHSLLISKPSDDDIGKYTCIVMVDDKAVANTTINAVGRGIVKTPSNVNVVEGEKLRIACQVLGNPIIVWEVGNMTYNGSETDTRITLHKDEEKDIPNAILVIQAIELSDRGAYRCVAINSVTKEEDSYSESFVRVKGKHPDALG